MAELRARYGPQAGSPVHDNAEYFVAYRADEAVGCAALQTMTAGVIELKRMFVPMTLRGQGVARALLAALESEATRRGVTWLRLQTGTRQTEAVALYESSGYRRVESWGKYAWDSNAICYEKTLI